MVSSSVMQDEAYCRPADTKDYIAFVVASEKVGPSQSPAVIWKPAPLSFPILGLKLEQFSVGQRDEVIGLSR